VGGDSKKSEKQVAMGTGLIEIRLAFKCTGYRYLNIFCLTCMKFGIVLM